jgi:foldase protein PrsA
MRRSILLAALAGLITSIAWAQVLDRPAATVRLTKTQSITVSQLQKIVGPLETQYRRTLTKDERKQVLDQLIGTALIEQAGDRDKVAVSEAELSARITEMQKSFGMQNLGRPLTEQEMQQYVRSNGMSWDDFQKQIKDQLLMFDYVRAKNKDVLSDVKPVTDSDIQDFYDAHKKDEFVDDMVTLHHVFIDTRALVSKDDREKARMHAEDVLKELKAGASFDDLVMKYSEDTVSKYKNGDIGVFTRSDPQRIQLFGKDFIDEIFKLKKGEISGVIASNIGFHIVKVIDRMDARLLTLDDKVPPQFQATLREFIKNNLTIQRQNEALGSALNTIIADLKKQAEVRVFDDNLSW